MSRLREVSNVLELAGVVLPVTTRAALLYEIDNIYNNEAALSRAIAHIRRGLDIIQELSQAHATIDDDDSWRD